MSAVPATKFITIEEYLLLEETSEEKHEYYQGEIFAMAGGSDNHNLIAGNAFGEIRAFLKSKPCKAFNSEQKVYIEANSLFTYPDVSVLCGEAQRYKNRSGIYTNPSVIIEVLSPSTANYDRGQKFKLYRDIPSLKEYVLISSTEVAVERYIKQSQAHWQFIENKDPEGILEIEAIQFQCPLSEIYRDVVFEEAQRP